MKPGAQLGPYKILSELGTGGMGTVFLAEKAGSPAEAPKERRRALKLLHPHLLATPGFFKRFLREAELGQRLRHQNVVRTLDVDALATSDGNSHHFLVMEYVEGQTLRSLLRELKRVPETLCRHIGREIASGLKAIHDAGVVHRDLKPENVLITDDHVVKIMDLGVARLIDEAMRLSQTGAFVGSVLYAAPEQFTADEPDHRADFYALGLMLYELATGEHPSEGRDLAETMRLRTMVQPRPVSMVNPQLSAFYEEVVHGLLEPNRDDRLDFLPKEESDWWHDRAHAIRQETHRPLRRVRIQRDTGLYGREAELGKLGALMDKVTAGEGQVVLVAGEAGVGKTRLVDEFVAGLGEDVNFLFGSYPPGGAATASGAFSVAYREHFGDTGCSEYIPETPLLAPAFDALLRGDAPPTGVQPLTPASLQTVFVHATRSLARERPTVVLIDDLHFAPDEGRALFAGLALALRDDPVLLIGTMRPGVSEQWIANLRATRIQLDRLGPKDLTGLLADAFGSRKLAEDLGFTIAEKSDGNPFFVFEIIRDLRDGRFLTQTADGAWERTRVIDRIEIPSSILDLVQARIADLSTEDKDLLEVAACCGHEFDPLLVAEAAGMDRTPALKRLARIEGRHRLVRSVGRKFVFDHHQIKEVLYERLPELLREDYHAALGESLEKRGSEDALKLCDHFLKGGRGDSALPYLKGALNVLNAGLLNAEVVTLAKRALDAPALLSGSRRVDVLLGQAYHLDLLGRRDEQREVVEEAIAIAHEAGDASPESRARWALGVWHWRKSQLDDAVAAWERARDLAAEAQDTRAEASAVGSLGNLVWQLGRLDEAQALFDRDVELAESLGDLRHLARARSNHGLIAFARGRHEDSLACFHEDLRLTLEAKDKPGEMRARGRLGNVFEAMGRLAEAWESQTLYSRLAHELGDRINVSIAASNLGHLSRIFGASVRAREYLRTSVALSREIGFRQGEAGVQDILGYVAQDEGKYDEARVHHERALLLHRESGHGPGQARSLAGLARIAFTLDDVDQARAHLDEAQKVGDQLDVSVLRARLPGEEQHVSGDALAGAGMIERTEAHYHLYVGTGERKYLDEAHRLLTHLHDHTPEEHRETFMRHPIHAAIHAAIHDAFDTTREADPNG